MYIIYIFLPHINVYKYINFLLQKKQKVLLDIKSAYFMLLKLRAIFWLATTSPGGMAKFPCEASSRHPVIATSWFLLPLTVLSQIVLPLQITLPSPHKYPPFLLLTED